MSSNINVSITTTQSLLSADEEEIEAFVRFEDLESGQKVDVPIDLFLSVAALLNAPYEQDEQEEPEEEPEEQPIELPRRMVVRSSGPIE